VSGAVRRGRPTDPAARRAVADAAIRVIARSGVQGATVRSIADELGSSTGAISHHFKTKQEMLAFAFRAVASSMMGDFAPDSAPPVERLHAVAHAFLADTPAKAARWRAWLSFVAAAATDDRLSEEQEQGYRELAGYLTDILQALRRDGVIATNTCLESKAAELLAALDGIGLHGTVRPNEFTPGRQRELARLLVHRLIK
jgi:AcrR family transcriptional regulator